MGHRTLLLRQPDAWVHLYIFIDSSKWEWGGLGVGGQEWSREQVDAALVQVDSAGLCRLVPQLYFIFYYRQIA